MNNPLGTPKLFVLKCIGVAGLLALASVRAFIHAEPATAISDAPPVAPPPLRAILLAGGPDSDYNQVSIENNAIFVQRSLPKGSVTRILFASGNPKLPNVQSQDAHGRTVYLPARISPVNGPASVSALWHGLAVVARADSALTASSQSPPAVSGDNQPAVSALVPQPSPLLLYFGGHGSPGEDNSYANTQYALWNDRALTVRRLAAGIKALPPEQSVIVVMAQCFSGGFGNLMFEDGDPGGQAVRRDLVGFFASLPQREASGCTPEVDQTSYTDFTGYFFAALSGRDRLRSAVTGADYNHDGVVGMDEALAYARIHDDSIDTPMCTSDTFLRRFVPMPNALIVSTPYSQLAAWATSAQKAALDGLCQKLQLTGKNRLARAYQRFTRIDADSDDMTDVRTIRFVFAAKTVVLQHQLEKYGSPALQARFAALQAAESANPLVAAKPRMLSIDKAIPTIAPNQLTPPGN